MKKILLIIFILTWLQAFTIPGGRENEIEDAFKIMQSGLIQIIKKYNCIN
jgi:hypothetical protein